MKITHSFAQQALSLNNQTRETATRESATRESANSKSAQLVHSSSKPMSNTFLTARMGKIKTVVALALFARTPLVNPLCNCGVNLKKQYTEGDFNSAKLVQVRVGCNDVQLGSECKSATREIEDFVSAFMEYVDDVYVRPNLDIINGKFINNSITQEDYFALREIIATQRNAASDAVEERIQPDCSAGLWTETLYKEEELKAKPQSNTFNDWDRWYLNTIRDNALCVSRTLETELLTLQADNTVNRQLGIDADIPFSAALNDALSKALNQDSSLKKGLTPYTKRLMQVVLSQRNNGVDIGNLRISTGEQFVKFLLMRAIAEPPAIRIPAAELSTENEFDQGDLGKSNVKCFPLETTVIVQHSIGDNDNPSSNYQRAGNTYELKQLSELTLHDQIVVSLQDQHPQTSPIIDFAHRDDNQAVSFLTIHYYDKQNPSEIHSLTASHNHNIKFGVFEESTQSIVEQNTSLGKLKQALDDNKSVYIQNGNNDWLPVRDADVIEQTGFIAPITQAGSMLVVPPQLVQRYKTRGVFNDGVFNDKDIVGLLSASSRVSCYSTLPDGIAALANFLQRNLWGQNENQSGAGQSTFFDTISHAADYAGHLTGHLQKFN